MSGMLRMQSVKPCKVSEWLSTMKLKDQVRPPSCLPHMKRPRFVKRFRKKSTRIEHERERARTASSEASSEMQAMAEAARTAAWRRRRRGREQERQRQRRLRPAHQTYAVLEEGERDPGRMLEELYRLSAEEGSPCPPSSERSSPALLSPSVPASRSSASLVPAFDSQKGKSTTETSRAACPVDREQRRSDAYKAATEPVSPRSFSAKRHLSRSAKQRIYCQPSGREERRRRFKEELRRRCGLKVWTWDELVSRSPCTLATSCPVTPPGDEEYFRFRHWDFSPKKLNHVMTWMRDQMKEQDKQLEAKFVELEREMVARDEEDSIDLSGERERLMELRRHKSDTQTKGTCAEKASVASEHVGTLYSSGSTFQTRHEAAKAFERHTLLYLDWEPMRSSEDESCVPRKTTNKINFVTNKIFSRQPQPLHGYKRTLVDEKASFRKSYDAGKHLYEVKQDNKSHFKNLGSTKMNDNYTMHTLPTKTLKYPGPKHQSSKSSLNELMKNKKESDYCSIPVSNNISKSRGDNFPKSRGDIFAKSSRGSGANLRASQQHPLKLPPLQKNTGEKRSSGWNENTHSLWNESQERLETVKLKHAENLQMCGEREDSSDKIKMSEKRNWVRPASYKSPLPPLREKRMIWRAFQCNSNFPSQNRSTPYSGSNMKLSRRF